MTEEPRPLSRSYLNKLKREFGGPHAEVAQFGRYIGVRRNCFMDTLEFQLEHPDWLLVHGVIQGWIGHAWCEKNGRYWNPKALSKEEPRGRYVISISVGGYVDEPPGTVTRKYTVDEARKQILKTGHAGPWAELGPPEEST